MDTERKKLLGKVANTIRVLSMEAVQKANSGHPGLPMGCAEFGAYLFGQFLEHNPKSSRWINRDRFILSAGHGSMLLYSCLHLAGYKVSLEDIKRFRQLHSVTPGHPEYPLTDGVEATTGPLGQGVGHAVGIALAMKILADKFDRTGFALFTSKVICLAGDGCLMEGVAGEASSLAGHLGLNNLILVHDANEITLDGNLSDSSSEDVCMRYRAYGWDVHRLDGYNFDQMDEVFSEIRQHQTRPCFIEMTTVIGQGSPHFAGSYKAHGAPLGTDEVTLVKKHLGIPEEEFFVPQSVYNFFEQKLAKSIQLEEKWHEMFRTWGATHPELYQQFLNMQNKTLPDDLEEVLGKIEHKNPIASRHASQAVLQLLAEKLPQLYGGSADLSHSDCTMLKNFPVIRPGNFCGRSIKFGVREFAMATAATGMASSGMILPFVGTFLTFSDYMRNAIRLAALSQIHVVYQLTHDSIFLGEDGPTHQPVEHLASLRAIPNLYVIRPADSREVRGAWLIALRYQGPSCIVLSRQALPDVPGTDVPYEDGIGKGAYIVKKETSQPHFSLFATGSEVILAIEVAHALEKRGKAVRVVSMPCWELFDKQPDSYKRSIIGGNLGRRVSIEAGVSFGWARWIGMDGISISVESFGASAPIGDLAMEFGFHVDAVLDRLLSCVTDLYAK